MLGFGWCVSLCERPVGKLPSSTGLAELRALWVCWFGSAWRLSSSPLCVSVGVRIYIYIYLCVCVCVGLWVCGCVGGLGNVRVWWAWQCVHQTCRWTATHLSGLPRNLGYLCISRKLALYELSGQEG